mmetsp:Transcript_15677/g.33875  ORF Transcript_15677/g.33875 Transcript_15677/m.33875 type:complete len:202 (+) Transcript_15677:145-750(+)
MLARDDVVDVWRFCCTCSCVLEPAQLSKQTHAVLRKLPTHAPARAPAAIFISSFLLVLFFLLPRAAVTFTFTLALALATHTLKRRKFGFTPTFALTLTHTHRRVGFTRLKFEFRIRAAGARWFAVGVTRSGQRGHFTIAFVACLRTTTHSVAVFVIIPVDVIDRGKNFTQARPHRARRYCCCRRRRFSCELLRFSFVELRP